MARYTGPVCRLCRREGTKLFLKGTRCSLYKCTMEKRQSKPGQQAKGGRRVKLSEYGLQLREKQKAKRMVGLLEKQFRRYFSLAEKQKGATGENLLVFLERRLDNVIYKLGLTTSRRLARQAILHRHFLVNGRQVDRPSFLLKEGDVK